MRRFMANVVTEIEFVDGDNVSNGVAENYEKHLAGMFQEAANELSLRTIKGNRVRSLQVGEIKTSL